MENLSALSGIGMGIKAIIVFGRMLVM